LSGRFRDAKNSPYFPTRHGPINSFRAFSGK
jgi:hypothetical protein